MQDFLLPMCNGWMPVECLSVAEERVNHRVDDLVEEQLREMGVESRVELEGHLVDNIRHQCCHMRVELCHCGHYHRSPPVVHQKDKSTGLGGWFRYQCIISNIEKNVTTINIMCIEMLKNHKHCCNQPKIIRCAQSMNPRPFLNRGN